MLTITEILKSIEGKADFTLIVKGKEAAMISVQGKNVVADVKDPFIFMDFGLIQDLLSKKKKDSSSLQRLKDAGFKVSLKYKGFKIDLV